MKFYFLMYLALTEKVLSIQMMLSNWFETNVLPDTKECSKLLCEDLTNHEEFKVDSNGINTHESTQSLLTETSTIIPQECGKMGVED